MVEQFGQEAAPVIRDRMDKGFSFVLLATPETRIYVRMIIERMFATLPVLSHLEIARGSQIKTLGSIS
jgi:flagellar biosynthesis protein FlhA